MRRQSTTARGGDAKKISKDPVFREDVPCAAALGQLGADFAFARDFRECFWKGIGGQPRWHDDDAVHVAEHPVPRMYDTVADADRLAVTDAVEPALRIERRETRREHGKIHGKNFV